MQNIFNALDSSAIALPLSLHAPEHEACNQSVQFRNALVSKTIGESQDNVTARRSASVYRSKPRYGRLRKTFQPGYESGLRRSVAGYDVHTCCLFKI